MKMNTMDALQSVLDRVETARETELERFRPRVYREKVDGRTAADIGSEPILHMRHFQKTGALSDALVADVLHRNR